MRWAVVVLLSGCSSILGIEDFKLGDAGGGDTLDATGTGYCLGPTGWRVCLPMEPTMPRDITQSLMPLSTTASGLCLGSQPPSWLAAGQPEACFIVGTNVTINAPVVQVSGGRPLVIFASDTITIEQQLDVASHGATRGPAAPSTACIAPGAAMNGTGNSGGGGGAGGSFMSRGGRGGTSTNQTVGGVPAGADTQAPTILRGGCSGGVGGNATGVGGAPGTGGGAVYLVAGQRIVINGFINASGTGGGGGGHVAGGGGGGSGGMIVLHAPTIGGNGGVVLANGGGGGGGGTGGAMGGSGMDPTPQMPELSAGGGGGGSQGGSGFAGTSIAADGGQGTPTTLGGGGGGGGGSGYIRANVGLSQIMQSPQAIIVGN